MSLLLARTDVWSCKLAADRVIPFPLGDLELLHPCLLWRHFVQKETWESQGGLVGPCGSVPDPVGVSPVPSLPWQWSVHLCACTFPLAPPALWLPSLAVLFLQAASVGTCARVWKTISTMISQVSLNIRIKITLMLKSKLKSICLNRHK